MFIYFIEVSQPSSQQLVGSRSTLKGGACNSSSFVLLLLLVLGETECLRGVQLQKGCVQSGG